MGAIHIINSMERLRDFQQRVRAKERRGEDPAYEAYKAYLIARDVLNELNLDREWRRQLKLTFGAVVVNNFMDELKGMMNDMDAHWQPQQKRELQAYAQKCYG